MAYGFDTSTATAATTTATTMKTTTTSDATTTTTCDGRPVGCVISQASETASSAVSSSEGGFAFAPSKVNSELIWAHNFYLSK